MRARCFTQWISPSCPALMANNKHDHLEGQFNLPNICHVSYFLSCNLAYVTVYIMFKWVG